MIRVSGTSQVGPGGLGSRRNSPGRLPRPPNGPNPANGRTLSASLSSGMGNSCLHLKRPCCLYSNPCLHLKIASPSRLRPPLPSQAGPRSLAGRKDDCVPAPDSFQHQTRNISLSDPMPRDATGTTKRALRHDRLPAILQNIHDCSWVTDPVRRRGSWTRPPASTAPPGFLRKISTGQGSKHSACAHKPSRSICRACRAWIPQSLVPFAPIPGFPGRTSKNKHCGRQSGRRLQEVCEDGRSSAPNFGFTKLEGCL